jgi:hypothetical protein
MSLAERGIVRWADLDADDTTSLLNRFGLRVTLVSSGHEIQGSYWGDSEAGLLGQCLYLRDDTPLHSVLHEACHFICMDGKRRAQLRRDAGGDDLEENAVCYLQILLADEIPAMGRARMQADMDAWGYTFRLGSAGAWFRHDADDAKRWLMRERLIDESSTITWRVRD